MQKKYRLPIIVITVLIVYLAVLLFTSRNSGSSAPDYTLFSTNKSGFSLFYDILKEIGYPVAPAMKRLTADENLNDVHIIIEPDEKYSTQAEAEAIMEWVRRGGRLIYLSDDYNSQLDISFMEMPKYQQDAIKIYEIGLGEVFRAPSASMTNIAIRDQREMAFTVLSVINQWGFEQIIIDEYYHGYQYQSGLWRKLPQSFKILCIQLGLALILIIWRMGKRFGRVVPYYEEHERQEDEYLKTIAATYRDAGMGNIALNSRYSAFVRQCQKYFNTSNLPENAMLVDLWTNKKLPHLNKLIQLQKDMSQDLSTRKKSDRRKFSAMMKTMEELSDEVKSMY